MQAVTSQKGSDTEAFCLFIFCELWQRIMKQINQVMPGSHGKGHMGPPTCRSES